MKNTMSSAQDGKLIKVTNIIWVIWWGIFYIIILPISISGIIYYILRNFVPGSPSWSNELSISILFLLIAPLVMIFLIFFDKYRKKKFFTSDNIPNYKHISIYFLISLIGLSYSLILQYIFIFLGEDFTFFFGNSYFFLRISYTTFTIISLLYYFITREFTKENPSVMNIKEKSLEKTFIILGFIIRLAFIILFTFNALIITMIIDISSFIICCLFYKTKMENSLETEMPVSVKNSLFFSTFPLIHVFIIAGFIFLNFGIVYLNYFFIFELILIIIAFFIKTLFLLYHYQLSNTKYVEYLKKSTKNLKVNSFASVFAAIGAIMIYFTNIQSLFFPITGIVLLTLLLGISFIDEKKELITSKFLAIFGLIISIILIGMISIIIPLNFSYKLIIFSILLYVVVEIFVRRKLISQNKTIIFQAFLFSAILLEVFFSIANSLISYLSPNFTNRTLEILFRFEIFSLAFLISTILTLIRTYFTRLKRKTNNFLKIFLLILQLIFAVDLASIISLNIGNSIMNIIPVYHLFLQILLPGIIVAILMLLIFEYYYKIRIYAKEEYIRILVFGIDIISLLLGIIVISFVQNLNSYFIMAIFLTISLIIHQKIEKNISILSDSKYEIRQTILLSILFFEIDFFIFTLLIQHFLLPIDISVVITSLVSIVILKIIPERAKIFTKKFSHNFIFGNFFIQLVFGAFFINSLTKNLLNPLENIFQGFLAQIPLLIFILGYLAIILTYGLKRGFFYRKIHVFLTNLSYFVLYLIISLIPTYVLQILVNNNVITSSRTFITDFTLWVFFISIVFIFYLDHNRIHSLFNGPKIWIENSIRKDYLNVKSGSKAEKIKRITEKTLEVWQPESKIQDQDLTIEESKKINPIEKLMESEEPLNLIYKTDVIHQLFYNIGWIFSLCSIIFSINFFSRNLISNQISLAIILVLSGLMGLLAIFYLARAKLIGLKLENKLKTIDYAYLIFSLSFVVYRLTIYLIPLNLFQFTFVTLFSLDVSVIFILAIVRILRPKLLEASPKFYYVLNAAIMILIGLITGGMVALFIKEITNLSEQWSNSFINFLFSNVVFDISSVIFTGFLFGIQSISYLKQYNKYILKDHSIINIFPQELIQDEEFSKNFDEISKKGVTEPQTESKISLNLPIIKTYAIRRIFYLIFYVLIPFIPLQLSLSIRFWFSSIIIHLFLLEAITIYFVALFFILTLDKVSLKNIEKRIVNRSILIVWIIFQALFSLYSALMIETGIMGSIFLFLLIYSLSFLGTNHYLTESGIGSEKSRELRELIAKFVITGTSSLYLGYIAINSIINFSDFQTISQNFQIIEIFRFIPLLIIAIHISFYWSYIKKNPTQFRFFRTFIFSFPTLIIPIYLMKFQRNLLDDFIILNLPRNIGLFTINTARNLFLTELGISLVSAILISFSLYYYYSTIHRENYISNFIYQMFILFTGFLFINNLIFEPFVFLIGGTFAPSPFSLYGIPGSPGIINFMLFERISFTLGLTFLFYYYLKKRSFFEIYKGFLDEHDSKYRHIGLIAGLGRTIAYTLTTYSILSLLYSITGISVGMFLQSSVRSSLEIQTMINAFEGGIAGFIGSITLYYFLLGYLSKYQRTSYKLRFILRIVAVLSLATSFGITVILYQNIFSFILPVILVVFFIYLIRLNRKYLYRGNITIGIAKSLLVYIFIFWILHIFAFGVLITRMELLKPDVVNNLIQLRPFLELFISIGVTGFVLSRSLRHLSYKLRRIIIPAELILSIILLCLGFYVALINIASFLVSPIFLLEAPYAALITVDFGILLFYFAIAVYKWKFSKEVWSAGWVVWLALPIVNFALILKLLSGIDFITETLNFFNVLNVSGSVLITVIIFTVLYFPVFLYKFKKYYNIIFLITWLEGIPLWIWMSFNLLKDFHIFPILSPLFIAILSLISALPLFYRLKFWKVLAFVWSVIAISNATFFSLLINVTFVPQYLMDIAINFLIYGIFIMIFVSNPVIKEKWKNNEKGLITGFVITFLGLVYVLFGIFYGITRDYIFAINLAGIISGLLLISGRTMEALKNKINRYVVILIAINSGFLLYRIFYLLNAFPITILTNILPIQYILNLNPFAFSIGLSTACGIFIVAQARNFISKRNWRVTYALFSAAVGLFIGSLLQSLFDISFNNYIGVFILLAIVIGYPSFMQSKIYFWFVLPIPFSFFTQKLLIDLFYLIPGYNIIQFYGLNVILWFISYNIILGIMFKGISKYYSNTLEVNKTILRYFGVLDENGNIFNIKANKNKIIEVYEQSPDEKKGIKKAIDRIDKIPLFFIESKNSHRLYSILILITIDLFGLIITQLIPVHFIYRFIFFLFIVSISNFITLYYNKISDIFQNEKFIHYFRLISIILLYFSIGFGISLIISYTINIIFIKLGIIMAHSVVTLNMIAFFSFSYYLTLVIFDNHLHLYSKAANTILKIIFWTVFMGLFDYFIFVLTNNVFLIFFVLTITGFNLTNHLKRYYSIYSKDLEILVNLEGVTEIKDFKIENPPQVEATPEETLGLDKPTIIDAPIDIINDDLISNIDLNDVKDAIDNIFASDEVQSDQQIETIPETQENIISESQNLTELSQISEFEAKKKLELIKKKQLKMKRLQNLILEFDAIIKQSFIIEVAYLIASIIILVIPKNLEFSPIYSFIFGIFIFSLVLSLFYNFTTIVPKKYRIFVAQIINIILFVSTIVLPIGIFNVYSKELKLVGDGVISPLGKIYIPNIIFLISFTLFVLLLQLLQIIKNYAASKNINLRRRILEKWNSIIYPPLILLSAFIIANFFSYSEPLITRLTIASGILFLEIIIDRYILKFYDRFTRSRIMLISWILLIVMITLQLSLSVPNTKTPLSLIALIGTIVISMQFVTVHFVYTYKNEKTIHYSNLNKEEIEKLLNRAKNKNIKVETSQNTDVIEFEQRENDDNDKSSDQLEKKTITLLNLKNYRERKYNILGFLLYILIGFFISSEIYENLLLPVIVQIQGDLIALGISPSILNLNNLFSLSLGIQFLSYLGLYLFSYISVSLFVVFIDRFFIKVLKPLTRDLFLLIHWIALSLYLLGTGIMIGIAVNSAIIIGISTVLSPLLYFIVSLMQYYTMFLITNSVIHSSKIESLSELYSGKIPQFSPNAMKDIEKIMGSVPEWDLMSQKNAKVQKKNYILELLNKIESNKIKFIRTINLTLGIFVFFFIGYSTYQFFFNFTFNIIFSLVMGVGVIYLQSEVNYFKIKSFREKYNFYFTLICWIAFSVLISILPLILWNKNPSFQFIFVQNIRFMIINAFYVGLSILIFTLTMFVTAMILKRKLSGLAIKTRWLKYLRVILYIVISYVIFSLLLPTSLRFALFIATLILYIEMYIESYKPILAKKTVVFGKIIAATLMGFTLASWVLQYYTLRINYNLGIIFAIIILTLTFPFIYNPFRHKKYIAPIYWLILAIEIGFLMNNLYPNLVYFGPILSTIFMVLYVVFFEFSTLIRIFKSLLKQIKWVLSNITSIIRKFAQKVKEFIVRYNSILILLLVILIDAGLYPIIHIVFQNVQQSLSISSAIASLFLYPFFHKKGVLKTEKTFSRMIYYSIIVYVMMNIVLYSFIRINILSFLISGVILSSILLVVIYRREKMYNLSIKWRFSFLLLTIGMGALLIILSVLVFTGRIELDF